MLRDSSGQNLRDHLIATAARLIDERGSADLAVRDIARQAQVADGALYNYFEDKEDLISHALLAHVGNVMASAPRLLPPPGEGTVAENLRLFIEGGVAVLLRVTPAFAGLIGQQVASSKVTVVDNGLMPGRRGSLNVDDEGTPTQETVLIENGILKGFLSDKLNARLMGMPNTGSGRRESYHHIPMPRMTNTYMLNGDDMPEDIIKSVKRGLYAVNFGGGSVDITNGKFVFSASEAYLIEDGIVTRPVKGATLIGNGPEALKYVSMVGNDLALDEGIGTCGKSGQSVPVGVGMPTVKLDRMTVGGTGQ